MIILEWDESKRELNKRNHGLDFADLLELFENETATATDDRYDYGEERLITFGLFLGKVVAVVHTETAVEDNIVIRIISAREAEKYEQEYYFKTIRD